MPPIDINPKYHSMPEKPHLNSCPQCGHIIADTTSGKCQNCGHLFDQRQFREQQEELPRLQYKTRSRTQLKKPKHDKKEPPSSIPDAKTEPICPQCKATVDEMDITNRKCPLCGYIGPMTFRQMDHLIQTPTELEETTDMSSDAIKQRHISATDDVSPTSDSSALRDAAPKDWKQAKSGSAAVKRFPGAKTGDKSKEWGVEPASRLSFAFFLQNIKHFSPNIAILRITGTLILAALIIFGIIKIMPVIFPSSSFTVSRQAASPNNIILAEISDVGVADNSITHSSVTITWTTNKQATSRVEYGTDKNNLPGESSNNILTENHRITISNLESNTTYYYKITCTDADGNDFIHVAEQPFITKMLPDTTPPAISNVFVNPSKITDVSAVISWEIDDKKADSYIEYGQNELYDKRKPAGKDSSSIRTAVLGGLKPNTTYHFRIIAEDNIGNKAEPHMGDAFITLAPIPTGTKVGDRAPDFNLEFFSKENLPHEYTISGNNVNLSDFRGKVVVVNFWSIACGACTAEMPDIQKVYDNADQNELIMLAIHTRQYRSRIERYFEKVDWSLPVLLDTNGDTSHEYGITRIPKTFFIDTEGIIQKVKLGRFSGPGEIESFLEHESLLGPR